MSEFSFDRSASEAEISQAETSLFAMADQLPEMLPSRREDLLVAIDQVDRQRRQRRRVPYLLAPVLFVATVWGLHRADGWTMFAATTATAAEKSWLESTAILDESQAPTVSEAARHGDSWAVVNALGELRQEQSLAIRTSISGKSVRATQ